MLNYLIKKKKSKAARSITAIIAITAISLLYLLLTTTHAQNINTNISQNDQLAYINIVKKIHEEPGHMGDRNRMPVYPYLQSLFYNSSFTDPEFFILGKHINIIISIVLLWLLFFVTRKYLSTLGSTVFMLIATFALFVFKAPYFQAEILFYFLSFLSYLLLTNLYLKNEIRIAVVAGIVIALAYLTKATILLAVIIFFALQTIHIAVLFFKFRTAELKKVLFPTISFLIVFISILSPYLLDNKLRFDQYFYNVNTTFYVWYDSWSEVENNPLSTKHHGDRVHWPTLPEEHLPSMQNYLKTHSLNDITSRLTYGTTINTLLLFVNYVIPSTLFIMIYFAANLMRGINSIKYFQNKKIFYFPALFFVAYYLSFSWYMAIESSPRFVQMLFLPGLFSLFYVLEKNDRHQKTWYLKSKKVHLFSLMILLIILAEIVNISLTVYSGA